MEMIGFQFNLTEEGDDPACPSIVGWGRSYQTDKLRQQKVTQYRVLPNLIRLLSASEE